MRASTSASQACGSISKCEPRLQTQSRSQEQTRQLAPPGLRRARRLHVQQRRIVGREHSALPNGSGHGFWYQAGSARLARWRRSDLMARCSHGDIAATKSMLALWRAMRPTWLTDCENIHGMRPGGYEVAMRVDCRDSIEG
jgi:hypothetical protein